MFLVLVVGCWLCVACCSLRVACCLLTFECCCLLCVARCVLLLFVVGCSYVSGFVLVDHCLLFVVFCLLLVDWCLLMVVCGSLFVVRCRCSLFVAFLFSLLAISNFLLSFPLSPPFFSFVVCC